MNAFPILVAAAAGCLIQSCARTPVLDVVPVAVLEAPTGIVTENRWAAAKPLQVALRRQGGGSETRTVELRAMGDHRAVSFLVLWRDDVRHAERRLWIWNPEASAYQLKENEVDRCAFFWPLGPEGDFHFYDAHPASYDIWLWQAGWTDLSGVADDERLDIEVHPADTSTTGLPLYRSADGGSRIAHRWTFDPGLSGVVATPQPLSRREEELPGAAAQEASGSIADVKARSLYKVDEGDMRRSWFVTGVGRAPGSWFGDDSDQFRQGFWLVQYYRMLATADKANDAQFNVPGPHRFVIAISDGDGWDERFVSEPIELALPE